MNLAKKDFSVFIFDENPVQARFLKEMLVRQQFSAHFYTSEDLLLQSIFLALPHAVILPASDKSVDWIARIQDISREIQIFIFGASHEGERMHRLLEQGLVFDYILDPVQFPAQFTHRIQRGMDAWAAMVTQENNEFLQQELKRQKAPLATSSDVSRLEFVEDQTPASRREDLADLLLCENEEVAIQFALKKLQDRFRKNFIYLQYDNVAGHLILRDIASGMTPQLRHLGIKLVDVKDPDHFFDRSMEYKIWSDFFAKVFKCNTPQAFAVKGKDVLHGLVVALGIMTEDESLQMQGWMRALSLLVDNQYRARIIYDYLPVELKSYCLNNKNFYERLNAEISRSRRHTTTVSVLSFRTQAESTLEMELAQQLVAKVLKRFTRVSDFVGRLTDAKIAVALPQTPLDKAAFVASRLQTILQKALAEKKSAATVYCGVSEFPSLSTDAMSLLEGSEESCAQADPFGVVLYTLDSTDELDLQI